MNKPILALLSATVLSMMAGFVHAQVDYPTRPIRLIVPTAAGGSTDIAGRILAQGLTERLNRQVVVENRPGAGTMIGGEIVAKAKPDGYTLLIGASALALNPAIFRKMPYDAERDLAPITQIAILPNVIIAHPSLPVRNVKDLIAVAQTRPKEILYSSGGVGTNPHLSMALLTSMAKIDLVHVPYKGGTPGLTAVIAGEAALSAMGLASAMPHVRGGRVRALAVTSASRVSIAKEIPTLAESGLPGYESVQWPGFLAPAGTPKDTIARLHREAVTVLKTPETASRLASEGAEVVAGTPEAFAAFIRAETEKWSRVVKAAGIPQE